MKTRTFLPLLAVLFAAFTLPTEVSAQLVKNTNQSRKLGSVLVGGSGNLIPSNVRTAFIGGGQNNTANGNTATVGGGSANTASGGSTTVGGGSGNTALVLGATVGGGFGNTANFISATVGGGDTNTAGGSRATVGGGFRNTASGGLATVGGGSANTASGTAATVGGGTANTASGNFSCVPGGAFADATNTGSFVFNGDSLERTASFADGTFTVRCEGGARFYTTDGTNVGPRLAVGGTDWVANSDSNLKTKITAINARDILAKLSQLPISSWQYKHNPARRYIGPMAQDFHAAFGLGDDDKGISTLDSDGVMYAAIQGLVEELKERDAQHAKDLSDRDAKIGELEAKSSEIDVLKAKLGAMEERINSLPSSH